MRKLIPVGAVLAIGGLGVMGVSAFADNTVWLCAGTDILSVSARCLILSENLEVVVLEDRGVGAEAAVECAVGSILDEGWVGPGSEDETTRVEFVSAPINCKPAANALNLAETAVANKCLKVLSVGAVNLPWGTLIELINGVAWDTLKPLRNGQPGFLVECEVEEAGIRLKVHDLCDSVAGTEMLVVLDNLPAEGAEAALVDVLFPKTKAELLKGEKEFLKCVLGGPEAGIVSGEILLAAAGNVSLEVSAP
jgi:hypothetical protein